MRTGVWRVDSVMGLFEMVRKHMGWDRPKTLDWFNTKNPLLGGISPLDMLAAGRHEKLKAFIEACIDEGKAPLE